MFINYSTPFGLNFLQDMFLFDHFSLNMDYIKALLECDIDMVMFIVHLYFATCYIIGSLNDRTGVQSAD